MEKLIKYNYGWFGHNWNNILFKRGQTKRFIKTDNWK